jgi:hypothetical protein
MAIVKGCPDSATEMIAESPVRRAVCFQVAGSQTRTVPLDEAITAASTTPPAESRLGNCGGFSGSECLIAGWQNLPLLSLMPGVILSS